MSNLFCPCLYLGRFCSISVVRKNWICLWEFCFCLVVSISCVLVYLVNHLPLQPIHRDTIAQKNINPHTDIHSLFMLISLCHTVKNFFKKLWDSEEGKVWLTYLENGKWELCIVITVLLSNRFWRKSHFISFTYYITLCFFSPYRSGVILLKVIKMFA